jgi:hypothetical protein
LEIGKIIGSNRIIETYILVPWPIQSSTMMQDRMALDRIKETSRFMVGKRNAAVGCFFVRHNRNVALGHKPSQGKGDDMNV